MFVSYSIHNYVDPIVPLVFIGGALWDLRSLMIAKYGPEAGIAVTDRFYYEATRRAVKKTSSRKGEPGPSTRIGHRARRRNHTSSGIGP